MDNGSLVASFDEFSYSRRERRRRKKSRTARDGEKRLFIDGIIREREEREREWPPYPEGGERNTGNQLAEERRHRATRYEPESGS